MPEALTKEIHIPMRVLLPAVLIGIVLFTLVALRPQPLDKLGGSPEGSYWQSIDYVQTGHVPADYVANRFVTGSGFIVTVALLQDALGSRGIAWLLLNSVFFVGLGCVFYILARRILGDPRAAFLSTLLLALNYAALVFGLDYAADVSGWFFFIASLFCSYRYFTTREEKWIWIAAALVGIGGIFKEYALCASVAIACSVGLASPGAWLKKILLLLALAAISIVPFIIANIWTWHTFHYTYLNWWAYNQTQQNIFPDSRFDEYIKILGGMYNFAWFFFIPGLYVFWSRRKEIVHDKSLQFIIFVALSAAPVLIWPPFQRVFFISMPAFALVSGLFFKRVKNYWLIVPLFAAYVLCGYLMDDYVLKLVNIQPLLHLLLRGR